MPKYRVRKLVDAYVHYTAEIEAESEADALTKAEEDYKYGGDIVWEEDDVTEYDNAQFEVDETTDA